MAETNARRRRRAKQETKRRTTLEEVASPVVAELTITSFAGFGVWSIILGALDRKLYAPSLRHPWLEWLTDCSTQLVICQLRCKVPQDMLALVREHSSAILLAWIY